MMHRDTYRLPVAPGTWRVTASFPSGLAATGTVEVGAGEEAVLDLEMPRGLTLSGQVLVDGQPLAEAEISVSPSPAPAERYSPTRATTRYDGSFSVPGLLPGRITLTVTSRGVDHAQHLDLTTDQTITIEISTGQGTLRGLHSSSPSWSAAGIIGGGTLPRGPSSGGNSASTLSSHRGTIRITH